MVDMSTFKKSDMLESEVPGNTDESIRNQRAKFFEAKNSELIGLVVESEEDAYALYNDYARRIGLSIRRAKQRYRRGESSLTMRQFVCSKEGTKNAKKESKRSYSRNITRTGCQAFIQFSIDQEGRYTVQRHEMEHTHDFSDIRQRHLMRSQRSISDEQIELLKSFRKCGIKLSDAIRFLKCQFGGSPNIGFINIDAYNALANPECKTFNGSYAKNLIEIFKERQENEDDFYNFDLDEDGRLCGYFWRDGIMKKDYDLFGLVVHDTTYRTNKYDMVCGPFVGMNQHTNNVMFGCGFIINERVESFVWLFQSFLKSMGDKAPITIMTDESAAMAAGIKKVFPTSKHRLCIWHIIKNSKERIISLRKNDGFIHLFNHLLKGCDSEAEFNFYWQRMITVYHCADNPWIIKFYKTKEKWCGAFCKEFFSGGILSSQRSETTNKSVSRRLNKLSCLCEFYYTFCDVVSEWRSNEMKFNYSNSNGIPEMVVSNSNLLRHARDVYTRNIYKIFEDRFLDGIDMFRHYVRFSAETLLVECTCKCFTQDCLLCMHSLRVLNIHCVQRIPDAYILKRWRKDIRKDCQESDQSLCTAKIHYEIANSYENRNTFDTGTILVNKSV
uniref:SWIM-type domain-containing protein n=1 Tax=Kalanchoe fedtschenkoi TaxID=63787 RepID=A0A7N0SXM3_KALFE